VHCGPLYDEHDSDWGTVRAKVGLTTRSDEYPVDVALTTFVVEHYARLLGLARLVCRDANDAADAVQLGLEQAWRKRSSLRDEARMRPWLDRIVVREAVRVAKGRRSWLGRLFASQPTAEATDPRDRSYAEPSTFVALRDAFAQLSPEQRAVVALHLHAGYTVAETATMVGAPIETVRSRLRLAKRRLRRELEEPGR
jgi:RNA polymerase sigma-70 factor, ECF subfamily